MTKQEANYLAEAICLQSASLLWFEHRKGRGNCFNFGCCFPYLFGFPFNLLNKWCSVPEVAAIKWGREKEAIAREQYSREAESNHSTFELKTIAHLNSGLHVNWQFPHLGTSPDGLLSCSGCGEGLLKIKCPYSKQDQHPRDIPINDTKCYLNSSDRAIQLSATHNYFYFQIQGQMAVCDRSYTDFVCWIPKGMNVVWSFRSF